MNVYPTISRSNGSHFLTQAWQPEGPRRVGAVRERGPGQVVRRPSRDRPWVLRRRLLRQEQCHRRGGGHQEDVLRREAVAGEVARHPKGDQVLEAPQAPKLHHLQRLLPQGAHCWGE